MGASKLKVLHVVIIGSVLCVALTIGLFYMLIKKADEKIVTEQARVAAAQAIVDQRSAAESDLAAAKRDLALVVVKYEKMMNEKMPALSFQDRMGGWLGIVHEQSEVLGPKFAAWPGRTGVKLTSEVSVPAPPQDANSVETNFITIPMGTFTVTGSFAKIMAHVRSWNKFDRLVQIDPVSLSGYSPNMTGQYNVTLYEFPRGTAGPMLGMVGGSAAPAAAATGAPAGGMSPGMGAGMGGGMGPRVPGMGAGMGGAK